MLRIYLPETFFIEDLSTESVEYCLPIKGKGNQAEIIRRIQGVRQYVHNLVTVYQHGSQKADELGMWNMWK